MKYDAFISYSHFLDSKLAPSIQAGLQRFGKPWYRARQLNIFRDETDLTASPFLWGKISAALQASDYFILLASPEAALSMWVTREIEYWIANKDIFRILIVLTSGAIGWQNRDFDWSSTTAINQLLRNKFENEPLYIDFTQLRSNNDLSLNNPDFKLNIAKISAEIQSMPLKDLIGKDVEEHRKTMRVRNAAIATIMTFLVGLVITAMVIYNQRNAALRTADASNHVVKALNKASVTQSLSHLYQAYQSVPLPYVANLLNSFQDRLVTFYNWIEIKDSILPHSMAYHQNEFFVGYFDGFVRRYNKQGEKLAENKLHFQSADGIIAFPGANRLLIWGYDTARRVYRVYILSDDSLRPVKNLEFVASIASGTLGTDNNVLLSFSDGMMRNIDSDGNVKDSLQIKTNIFGILKAFHDRQGNYIVLDSQDGNSGLLRKFSNKGKQIGQYLTPRNDYIVDFDYHTRTGQLVALDKTGTSFLWDTAGLAYISFSPEKEGLLTSDNNHSVKLCVFSPAGDYYATILDDKCLLIDSAGRLKGEAYTWGRMNNLAFSVSGEQFYTFGAGEPAIIFWDNRGFVLNRMKYPEQTELIKSRQGSFYAVGNNDSLRILDVFENRLISTFSLQCDSLRYFDNYNDELMVFAGDSSIQVIQKRGHTYTSNLVKLDPQASTKFLCLDHFNNRIYFASSKTDLLYYNLITGKTDSVSMHSAENINFVYAIAENELLIGGGKFEDTSFLGLYNAGFKLVRKLEGHPAEVTDAAVTPDGRQIVSVDTRGKMILWEKSDGHKKFFIDGGVGLSMSVDVSPDGKYFITNGMFGNETCIIDQWGNKIQAQVFSREPIYLKFAPDGNFVVIARNTIYKLLSLDNFMNSGRIAGADKIEKLEKTVGLFSYNFKAMVR